jgi:hypothetical protein
MKIPNQPVNAPQFYCPWCGGGLTDEWREAANQMRRQMDESVSRWRAAAPSAKGASKSSRRRAKAKRLEPAVLRPPKVALKRRRARNSPNPAAADGKQVE